MNPESNEKYNIPQIPAKTIISAYSDKGWFGTNYTMNIYKGCCHGCIYCDSRSECYGVKNFDIVRVKQNPLTVIEADLKRKRKKGIIISGAMSDPYNPFEKDAQITRKALELIDAHRYGALLITKSPLVARDTDIFQSIRKHSSMAVHITITTAEDSLCRKIEKYVPVSSERFKAIRKLSDAGITCGVLLTPILPFINDTEENIISIVQKASESGAKWVYAEWGFGVTLRQNQRQYFYDRLDEDFKGIKEKYIKAYGNNYVCTSPESKKLYKVFTNECEKYGLIYNMKDITECIKNSGGTEQLSLTIVF